MSRGKAAPSSKNGLEDIYGAYGGKLGVSDLTKSGKNRPPQINHSGIGAGFNRKTPSGAKPSGLG